MLHRKVKECSAGFTIIESVFAMLLLLIMMTGGMAFYIYASKHATENVHQKNALKLADSQMEYERSLSSLVEGTTSVSVFIGSLPGTMTTAVSAVPVSSYKQVTVTVTWSEPGVTTDREIVLQTYMAP